MVSRVLIPLAKYHVSDRARQVVAEGMEIRGGNAYIEEWPNARILRDVHVQAIWEGTGNISALDVTRALVRGKAGPALFAVLQERLGAAEAQDDAAIATAARLARVALTRVQVVTEDLETLSPQNRDLLTRRLTRDLAHAVTAVLLVEDAAAQAAVGEGYRCLLQAVRYLRQTSFPPTAGLSAELDRTPIDHFDAIVDWSPALPAAAAEPLLTAMARQVG
jgi:hypothetical protein